MEYLNNVYAEFSRLEELLKAIRAFTVFEHLAIKPTDVNALVRNLLQLLQKEIGEKGIALTVAFPEHSLWAACDARALHQALLQVFSNAIDALANRPDPALAISLARDEAGCSIRIADNGCGIAADKRQEVFLPFYSSKPRGVGLGLTMVKKLLTRMAGTVEVIPRTPQGTEILITLPAANPHDD
jgi:C4-dicarboxylate-specific signal transduction histidine kinase